MWNYWAAAAAAIAGTAAAYKAKRIGEKFEGMGAEAGIMGQAQGKIAEAERIRTQAAMEQSRYGSKKRMDKLGDIRGGISQANISRGIAGTTAGTTQGAEEWVSTGDVAALGQFGDQINAISAAASEALGRSYLQLASFASQRENFAEQASEGFKQALVSGVIQGGAAYAGYKTAPKVPQQQQASPQENYYARQYYGNPNYDRNYQSPAW